MVTKWKGIHKKGKGRVNRLMCVGAELNDGETMGKKDHRSRYKGLSVVDRLMKHSFKRSRYSVFGGPSIPWFSKSGGPSIV